MRRIVLLLACVATGASAQPAPGGAPSQGPAIDPKAAAVSLLNTFARCVARTQPREAQKVLAAAFLSDEQNALASVHFKGVELCWTMSNGLQARPPAGIVGGMAEELYLSRHGKKKLDELISGGAAVMPRAPAEDLALCIVRADPQAARAVLDATPTTPEEGKAIGAIVPQLGSCMPQGETMTLNKSTVRTLVAVGFFLLSEPPKA
jgi:hypothetical protein